MTHQEATERFKRTRKGRVKLDHNTYLLKDEDDFVVELHGNRIIRIHPDSTATLSRCGWPTDLTANRLNKFCPTGTFVYVRYSTWFFGNGSAGDVVFFDNMRVDQHGKVLNSKVARKDQLTLVESRKDVLRRIREYVSEYVERLILDLPEDTNSGTCTGCWDSNHEDAREALAEHLWEHHIKQEDYDKSILWMAIRETAAMPKEYFTVLSMSLRRGDRAMATHLLRSFFRKRQSIIVDAALPKLEV